MSDQDHLVIEPKDGSDASFAKTFEAAGKPVPEFEYTPRSVAHLCNFLTVSKANDEAARLVARDFRQEAAEYRSQVIQPLNIWDFQVPELNGDNFKFWKEKLLFQLGWMDIDYAIRKDEPPMPTDTSTILEKNLYECWERSNRLSMMYIKSKISTSIRGSIGEYRNVRDLLRAIDEQFKTSDKALISTLMTKLSSMKFTGVRGVREHIIQIRDIAAQLKTLEVEMSESFLVHFILNSLPSQYGPFKITYNTRKEKWSINELLTMCAQEEGRLIMEMGESAHMVTQGKGNKQAKSKGKAPIQVGIKKESKCFFCKKKGHIKKDCNKFKAWLEKKGLFKPKEANGQ